MQRRNEIKLAEKQNMQMNECAQINDRNKKCQNVGII